MKKQKIIIDTDPGVDDTTALVFAFFNKKLDIKLISTVSGNVGITKATRNACHLLDLFNKDIPVVKGAATALNHKTKNAEYLHGPEGLGGYIPPKTTLHKPLSVDAIDKMYEVITQNPHEVTILILGPQTNVGKLLKKYPECAPLIKEIVFMGGSPYDEPGIPLHDSFNIKNDADAFNIVLNSNIKLKMLPSNIGRYKVGLDEETVQKISKYSDVGKFLSITYQGYLEPNMLRQDLKIVATNDTSALFCILYPKIFETEKANVRVDTKNNVGRTYVDFCKDGKVEVVLNVNKQKFMKKFFECLKQLNKIKFNIK